MALHVVLAGMVAAGFGSSDSFSAICHTVPASGMAGDAPGDPKLLPGQACEHCNLCGSVALAAPEAAVAAILLPARLIAILRPVATASADGHSIASLRARGPPSFA